MFLREKEISIIKAFPLLESSGLDMPDDSDYTVGVYSGEELVGTGSVCGCVLQGIAVKKEYRGLEITSRIVTNLVMKCIERSIDNFFIFTKFTEKEKFISMGFSLIGSAGKDVVLLEYDRHGIEIFKENLKKISSPFGGRKGCAVMNCNPFTNGHLHLIKKGSENNDHFFVIVVEEDCSVFPFKTRFELIKKGISHLENVTVISGGKYTISSATFPSYFIKKEQHTELYAALDIDIFIKHTATALGINCRYIGEEPYCPVTSVYNRIIKETLPDAGIDVTEIKRLETEGEIISASKVRAMIKEGRIEETGRYLPETTFDFLFTEEAASIISRIKKSSSRH